MTITKLLKEARTIWGKRSPDADQTTIKLKELDRIIVRMGVVYGDICRWRRERDRIPKNGPLYDELQKEMGNMILSTIRWCDDLGFDPEDCIVRAIDCQQHFKKGEDR
jgi:hypothetical protein